MKKKPASARAAALWAVELALAGAKAQEAVDKAIEEAGLGGPDRALCSDLAYGWLRSSIKLEFLLKLFLKKWGKLPKDMRIMLGLGLHSILHQDRVPPHAAVNETVEEIKRAHGKALAGVANGVLRNLLRLGSKLNDPEWLASHCGDRIQALSVIHAMPEPVVKLWLESYGEGEALRLLAKSGSRPWQGFRINPLHGRAGELAAAFKAVGNAEAVGARGWALPPGAGPGELLGRPLSAWIEDGALSRQAPASMLILEELGLDKLEGPIWDCCAGAGIKSAALLERGAKVALATDSSLPRLEKLEPFCARLGLAPPIIAQASALRPPLDSWPGHMIVDAPCSGTGELARRPDIRARLLEDGFWIPHAKLQKEILRALITLLQPGKKLAYMTCAVNPHENGEVIREILKESPSLALEKEWQSPASHPWLDGMHGFLLVKKAA